MACSFAIADDLDTTGLSDSSDSLDSEESLYEELVDEEGLPENGFAAKKLHYKTATSY